MINSLAPPDPALSWEGAAHTIAAVRHKASPKKTLFIKNLQKWFPIFEIVPKFNFLAQSHFLIQYNDRGFSLTSFFPASAMQAALRPYFSRI
jgi:hypothetical protein